MARIALALVLLAALVTAGCGSGSDEPAAETPTPSTVASAEPPAAALVSCGDEAPVLESPTVAVQPDGVHLEIANAAEGFFLLSITSSDGGLGLDAPVGDSTQIVDLAPGTWSIACYDPLSTDGGEQAAVELEVVDPDGLWVSTSLDCDAAFAATFDYIAGAKGETDDPVEAARTALKTYALDPDDAFEPAGYPEAATKRVRLVRAGETLAVVDLLDDGAGGWLPSTVNGCSSLQG